MLSADGDLVLSKRWTGGFGRAAGMVPDVERIIESIVQGDQDSVQLLLHTYNIQVTDCCHDY